MVWMALRGPRVLRVCRVKPVPLGLPVLRENLDRLVLKANLVPLVRQGLPAPRALHWPWYMLNTQRIPKTPVGTRSRLISAGPTSKGNRDDESRHERRE